jgi:predicted amidophosphoribosyltransferase
MDKKDSSRYSNREHTRINVVPLVTKKCPFCSNTLSLSETVCPSCKNKVGEPDKDGVAKIPGTWKKYVSAMFAIALVVAYLIYGRNIIAHIKSLFF